MDALLGGLEITIMPLSTALSDNRDTRIDSTYFTKEAIAADALISARKPSIVSEVASEVKSFGAYALTNEFEYEDEGIPFIRGTNFAGDFINFGDALKISEEAHKLLHKSEVKPGMVLFSMSGSVGSVAVALDTWTYPINSNQDIAKIVPRKISPYYLAAFLSGKFGEAQVKRLPVGSVQQHIFLWMIERMKVPRFDDKLEQRISSLAALAYATNEGATVHSDRAEAQLLKALGLANWAPPEPLAYVASSADAFASGRLDAQYFMPAKTQVQEALRKLPGKPLGERFASIRQMMDPKKDNAPLIVRNYDVTDALQPILNDEKEPVATEEIGSTKKVFKHGDVAISRLRAYLREIAVVRTDGKIPSVGSSEFIVLRPKTKADKAIAPETLLTFLRSAPVQTILKWCQDGSQHPRFSEGDLLAIHLPDAVEAASAEIATTVQEGFEARRNARALLDAAKRAVEIAIEDSEAAALAYLDKMGAA